MNTYQSDQVRGWIGYTAYDINGEKVGTIEDVYQDHESSGPEWFAIRTGLFGTKHSLAPVNGSTAEGERLVLPWSKEQIKNAPNFDSDDELEFDDSNRLYGHYNMKYDPMSSFSGDEFVVDDDDRSARGTEARTGTGRTGNGRGGDGGDDAMTRSEEELNVSTRQREGGRVRLNKWVETEQKQITVPVRREVAKLVTEPITDANRDRAMDGPELTENDHDVILHEDEVVVEKKVVPKERVRLETDTVEDERQVDETVRKERIAMDDNAESRR